MRLDKLCDLRIHKMIARDNKSIVGRGEQTDRLTDRRTDE